MSIGDHAIVEPATDSAIVDRVEELETTPESHFKEWWVRFDNWRI